ncbi:MAG: hypothetical protein R3A46_17955 [Thermomicrobiales bacterium]
MSKSDNSPMEVVPHPFAFRLLEVLRSTWITPKMVRVTLGGDAIEGFRSDAGRRRPAVFPARPG